ncbi:MAG TPA: ComF family protein [Gammaproteobacteria bacterium]|nr:ComF family protein [Gammaproteobacteria bacterium]
MVYQCLKFVQSLLFPPVCRLCLAPGLPDLDLCAACRDELPWLDRGCECCAAPLPEGASAALCPRCQKRRPPLDRCRALFQYRKPVDAWIQALKFNRDLAAARLLGGLLLEHMPEAPGDSRPVLIPVPLHRARLGQRGYNQSLEIARPWRSRGYRIDTRLCRRRRSTRAQSELPADARRGNVRDAFAATAELDGGHFVLIDDVMTTGATLNELARTLKRAGARRVDAWVIARTAIGRRIS